ncbi:MAG: ribosome maturation factor RimM [Acidimicrobiales bacterium]
MSGPARGIDDGSGRSGSDTDHQPRAEGAGSRPEPPVPMLQVGHVVKPHGLRGDVIVSLATNRDERVAPGSVLSTDDGRTMKVLRSSPHQGRFIVTFEGLSGIDDAERARGTQLFAPPLDDPDALWIHDLIGAEVEDTTGRSLGTVDSVEANPASDLLVLDGGALIPLRFVVGNEPGVRVTVEVPDGLLDLP